MENLTPMMQQYMSIKKQYEDCILFFRLGDFYEMFFDDALTASRELEITLTQRDCGMSEKAPMCGVPHHVSDSYVSRLVEKGYKVAICEQIEDPALAKGIVQRDVIKVVTPGTITDQTILDEKSNNYLVSIYLDNLGLGISYVDNSTGEMYTTELIGEGDEINSFLIDELGKILPSEIICNDVFSRNTKILKILKNTINPYINIYKEDEIAKKDWKSMVLSHFDVETLEQIELNNRLYSIIATGKLIDYLYKTQKSSLEHINSISYYKPNNYMILDISTRANLEIHETIIKKDRKGALIGLLDKTSTSMGGRLLKKWLEQPLVNIAEIEKRNSIVEYFFNNIVIMDDIKSILRQIYDIERLASKISNGNCNARDLISLKSSISVLPDFKRILKNCDNIELGDMGISLDTLEDIYLLLEKGINENPPISLKDGGLIKEGYDSELDKIREACLSGKEWLAALESKEREKTGIKNLKVGFNKIYGYYFEVTKSNISSVPDYFIRKQTLTNSERYYTEELKNMEDKILGAEVKSLDLEYQIFSDIRNKVKKNIERIQNASRIISQVDVLNAFAQVAYKLNFVKPNFNKKGIIHIVDGRHPVVENNIENNLFIPNDTYLDTKNNMVQIITGPNMAGKSTYMRQVAIITLLAHIGAFVPASSANISVVDRIFTRIGAADNLSQGESTFMVEMNEVSNIIRSATKNSLIILDEVGRGTSTYDGLSIAWAIVEHITNVIKAKTLFATHYHELTQLQAKNKGIKNLTIAAEEKGDQIVFLRKIVEGSTNRSYGIEVAKLAGINRDVIDRANEILSLIEGNHQININNIPKEEPKQLNLIDYKKDYYLDKVLNLDIDSITPRDALNILYNLRDDAKKLRGDNNG
ncbi:DNA mismatch repair protein MutS [uncultured Tissierella sp.]|uniref:DNA mismatch repair protein MutS n=1 Tax=uncultured Tissierella sp. TaxID=448160 RepID=UPI002806273E|nr:DNA mismatch repair protein MutS [uncultured Tissierella sp.]MDU5079954.1 DNA mismatch repair protein MutS [Bacillota bacterium]